MFLAYFGPETMMPMTSVLAVVAGVFMMLGRQAFTLIRVAFRKLGRLVGLVKAPAPSTRPKVAQGSRLDPAEPAIHGAHATEPIREQVSELDEAR